jgi:predicted DNA-binding protein with PD1-like motif
VPRLSKRSRKAAIRSATRLDDHEKHKNGRRRGCGTRVVILESGEEAFAALTKFANDAGITAASLSAIGAFEKATVGWFDFEMKTYKKIEVSEQCEA